LPSLDEVVSDLLERVQAVPPVELVALAQASGRVLAERVTARVNVPGHDNSAMDGYAVRVSDLASEGAWLPVALTVHAGDAPAELASGSAARIFTGAPIPAGADAVVMQERCEIDGEGVRINQIPERANNIRRAGEDIARGDTVLNAGQRLGPAEVGVLASVGADGVPVYRCLRVAVFSTGDELVPAGEALAPGQIHDSNGPMLAALVRGLGLEAAEVGHLPDDLNVSRQRLREAAGRVDAVVTVGGVSVGDADVVKSAVEAEGELGLWQVAIKPGKPFAFGSIGSTPFFGLPGNPVSAMVTFLLLVRPFLLRQQGVAASARPRDYPLPAGFDWSQPNAKRTEFLRVRLRDGEAGPVAELYPHQGSGVLSSMAWADGLVRVDPGEAFAAGDRVRFIPFSALFEEGSA
jgi:molybdopterin molybdotransferase